MEKKLHDSLCSQQPSAGFPDARHTLYQAALEDEYAAELAFVKNSAPELQPRPEAVQALLQMIAPRVAENQH